MRRPLWIAVAAFAVLLSLLVAAAAAPNETPNDPRTNPDANACYTGGSMAGKCGLDDELWKAGWYEIRLEFGLITHSQVPAQYQWLTDHTPEVTEEPSKPSRISPPPPCFSLSKSTSEQPVCFRAPALRTI